MQKTKDTLKAQIDSLCQVKLGIVVDCLSQEQYDFLSGSWEMTDVKEGPGFNGIEFQGTLWVSMVDIDEDVVPGLMDIHGDGAQDIPFGNFYEDSVYLAQRAAVEELEEELEDLELWGE